MMLLKEFALITEERWRRDFELQTRCTTSLYERLFPKFKTSDCWKILVNCVPDKPRPKYLNLSGVYKVDTETDVESFFLLSDVGKKEWTLKCLKQGIDKVLIETGWPVEPFVTSFQKASELRLQNHWVWKTKRSPIRKLIADVLVKHGVMSCAISIVVRDRDGHEITNQDLIIELPDEWFFKRHLGNLRWESEERVVLSNQTNDKFWYVEL